MTNNYKTTLDLIKKLKDRYFYTLGLYWCWEGINRSISEPDSGKIATENLKIANSLKNFYSPTQKALQDAWTIELSKFFDEDLKSRSLKSLFKIIDNNLDDLNVQNFKKIFKGQTHLHNLEKKYKKIDPTWFRTLKKEKKKHNNTIKAVKDLRNTHIAHDDFIKTDQTINRNELLELFRYIEKVLNDLSSKLEANINIYSHVEKETLEQINTMFSLLRDGQTSQSNKLIKSFQQNSPTKNTPSNLAE